MKSTSVKNFSTSFVTSAIVSAAILSIVTHNAIIAAVGIAVVASFLIGVFVGSRGK